MYPFEKSLLFKYAFKTIHPLDEKKKPYLHQVGENWSCSEKRIGNGIT